MGSVQEDVIKLRASLLRTSVALANVTAKIVFVSRCLSLGVPPKGFNLKFSLQSGLPLDASAEFETSIGIILSNTSLELVRIAKEADVLKLNLLYSQLEETFKKLDGLEFYFDLAVTKFRKILGLRVRVHQNKLKKLCNNSSHLSIEVEKEVNSFASKLSRLIVQQPTAIPVVDWFDNPEYPPLPSPARRDWTMDIAEDVLETTVLNAPSEDSSIAELVFETPEANNVLLCDSATAELVFETPLVNNVLPLDSTVTENEGNEIAASEMSLPVISAQHERFAQEESQIQIIAYSSDNFKPLVLHDVVVSDAVIALLKKGPTFSPTPMDPPDVNSMEVDLDDWMERVRWAYLFRKQQLMADPQSDLIMQEFVKPPWYCRTDRPAPKASEEVELFMNAVKTSLLAVSNFVHFSSNITSEESRAFTELRHLKTQGISVFLQDKSSRFVIAKKDIIAQKVEADLDDSRYARLEEDDVSQILDQIDGWYSRYKGSLSGIDSDIRKWLVNPKSKAGKLKVLLKTHKQGLPVLLAITRGVFRGTLN